MEDELSTRQFVERTGVPEGTLRMWERRHAFPTPQRLPGGHRRYSVAEVELVQRVARDRAAGITLATAIARARQVVTAVPSVFAALRRDRPELEPRTLRRPLLLALTHAIEDESLARAQRPLSFGSFQHERFYRQSEARWRALAQGAETTVAFADFAESSHPPDAPIEVAVDRDHPLAREWAVVFWAPGHTVCLSAWEPPPRTPAGPRERVFEAVWSVEPEIVHRAASVCAAIASERVPELAGRFTGALRADAGPPANHQLRLSTAITNRTLEYLSQV